MIALAGKWNCIDVCVSHAPFISRYTVDFFLLAFAPTTK
jgi:hypothetical protein